MYGLKGMAAYTHHAEALGATSADAYAYINKCLHFLAQPTAKDPGMAGYPQLLVPVFRRCPSANFTRRTFTQHHSATHCRCCWGCIGNIVCCFHRKEVILNCA